MSLTFTQQKKSTSSLIPARHSQQDHQATFQPPKDAESPLQPGFGHEFSKVDVLPGERSGPQFSQSCPLALPSPRACPFGGACHTCPAPIQAKLTISQPGDRYEQEADRVADQVMAMPEPRNGQRLQRECSECENEVKRQEGEPEDEEKEKEEEPEGMASRMILHRQDAPSQPEEEKEEEEEPPPAAAKTRPGHKPVASPGVSTDIQGLRSSGGQPLSPSSRAFFEPRFGHDFSRVRVHNDAKAADTATAVKARAFTVGKDIVFGGGQYAPDTQGGRRLMAHELAHVVQQTSSADRTRFQRREEPGAPVTPSGAKARLPGATRPATGRPSPDNRTGQEIYVIDFGVNRNVMNWREAIFHIDEIEAESVDQMVRDVRGRAGDPANKCIRKLILDGHGSPGNMSVGDGTGWVKGRNISTGNFRPSLNRLTRYFCEGATVVLLGCNVGRGAIGARFIQTLSDFWQVNISAATGKVNGFGIKGVWVWGIPGQVLPRDETLIVDQIIRILDETTYGDDEEMIFDLLEGANARGVLAQVRADLTRQGRWDGLRNDLRGEDEGRYNRLFPGKP